LGDMSRPVSADWYKAIAELIDAVSGEDFPRQLVASIGAVLPLDWATIVIHRGRAAPCHVFDNFADATARQGIAEYLLHTYVLNPFFQAHLRGLDSGVYRIRDLAPPDFFASEYYRQQKIIRSQQEEIGYVTENWPQGMEEIDLAVVLGAGITAEIGLYRARAAGGFADRDLAWLRQIFPVIDSCMRAFWARHQGRYTETGTDRGNWVERAFEQFGAGTVTGRERRVLQMVLRGHSSESIADHLAISTATVKSHRKNAYEKLGISTQAELLSLFLDFVRAGAPRA
jgi:DNA-binding CsgD family transcriptional regulator